MATTWKLAEAAPVRTEALAPLVIDGATIGAPVNVRLSKRQFPELLL